MNILHKKTPLNFYTLIIVIITSSCSQPKETLSPISTSQPNSKTTITIIPSPTITSEPINPGGTIIYSDYKTVYLVDLQSLKTKSVFSTDGFLRTFISKDYIYINNRTSLESSDAKLETFRMSVEGAYLEQFEIADETKFPFSERINISPNERYIAYYKNGKIVIVDTSTKTTQSIYAPPPHGFLSFAWASDSNTIFIVDMIFHNAIGEHMRILQYSLDSQKTTELLSDFPDPEFKWFIEDSLWYWSPDSKYLLIKNHAGVHLFDTEKKSLKKISINHESTANFTWSTNGKHLLVHERKGSEQIAFYIFDIENSEAKDISDFAPIQYGFTCLWSPNGSMILCESVDKHLYLIDLIKKVSRDIAWVDGLKYSDRSGTFLLWFFHPAWSSDSKYFSYLTMSNPSSTAYEQDFILNIQSVETGAYLQIQIPREKEIEQIYWR